MVLGLKSKGVFIQSDSQIPQEIGSDVEIQNQIA